MEVLSIVLPVFVMLALGMTCSRMKLISREGMDGIKLLATNIMLPVVLVDALGTAEYNATTLLILIVMFVQLLIALGAGYLFRPLVGGSGKYLPFLTASFEGGMMGYPLYMAICGTAMLSNIATLDMANCIFTFTVYLALITATGKGKNSGRELLNTVLHAPAMYGVAIGMILGVTGILPKVAASSVGGIYSALVSMITTPVSALILLCVGYDLQLDRRVLTAAGKSAAIRLVLQAVLLAGVWLILSRFVTEREMFIAIVLYAFMPPCFMSPLYAVDERDKAYTSTTISLYTLISIAAFTVLTVVFS
ncbi:AEC family transporter [Anaerotignum lactatifermentans]|uniref:AEC family transporter n=1 Tax=Anaerotignum lactatifermentans TaxID=160404 RepID=A0ABS2G833_9FIRM|nr:AEC family transporter [Anaerotignum lactatifermentans]MBM6828369.1 AEC family transporter [Anaerotignum lactatifermentans]MBM6877649.1 AEC family transporter [Anaerotignum lactatifermentans]MBM6949952.1 AEC family transporter [Anaerotignum lactatifermentans]